MRSHCGLYVDAGYLIASAATRVTGTSLRSGVDVDYASLVTAMIDQAEKTSGLPLLRVNWYDSGARIGGNPDRGQEEIGLLPHVKLRLGRVGYSGEQKGVDLRIGLDLVAHARNRAVDVMYLVSGDDDLTEAVEEAQGHGVQVIILAVPGKDDLPHAVSRHLRLESDGVDILTPTYIDSSIKSRQSEPTPATPVAPSPAILAGSRPPSASVTIPRQLRLARETPVTYSSATGHQAVDNRPTSVSEADLEVISDVSAGVLASWRRSASVAQWEQLRGGGTYIPPEIDRALLLDLCARLEIVDLDEPLRYELRRSFWEHVANASGE